MTAHLHIEPQTNLEAAALAVPGAYEGEVRLARMIAEYLCGMPLETMSARAGDESSLTLVHESKTRTAGKRCDCEVIEVLASARRQLMKIRARYGA